MTDVADVARVADAQSVPAIPLAAPVEAPLPALPKDPHTMHAHQVLGVVVLALSLTGILNSGAMVQAGEGMDDGWIRTLTLGVAHPLDDVARFLRLDRPRHRVDALLGRTQAVEPVGASDPLPASSPSASPAAPVDTSPSAVPSAAPPSLAVRDVTSAAPLRLLITGDSMIESFAGRLVNLGDDAQALRGEIEVKYSTGLVRPDFFDWSAYARAQMQRYDVDAVVIMMGGNDGQNIRLADGRILTAASPEWEAEYARRAADVMRTFAAQGRRVYWVGMPIPRSGKLRPRFESANAAVRQAADQTSGVRYISSWDVFAKNGAYTDYLPDASGRPTLMRNRDGIHLSRAGAQRLATHVLPFLNEDWHLLDGDR